MVVKTITVTEEAYRLLAREKRMRGFSQVIKRLTRDRGRLSGPLGAWKMSDEEAEEIFSSLKQHWKESTMRLRGEAKNA